VSAFALLRLLHIAAGFAALAAGLVPLAAAKGGRAHRRWGKVYVACLGFSGLTAGLLAGWRGDLFMLSLSALTLYFLATGWRALRWAAGPVRVGISDRLPVALLLLLSLASLGWNGLQLLRGWGGGPDPLHVVGLVFGALGTAVAWRDIGLLRNLAAGLAPGLFEHLMRMISSYIAATTAFAVTNLGLLPTLVRWLGPTLAGTALIVVLATRQARAEAAAAEAAKAAAEAARADSDLPAAGLGALPPRS
jgi:uncharacterized membrane protein